MSAKEQGMPQLSARQLADIRRMMGEKRGSQTISLAIGLPRSTVQRAMYHLSREPVPRQQIPDPNHAIALYRTEVARRAERLALRPEMQDAKQAMQDRLALDKLNQRGGRPKGSGKVPFVFVKPGKPQLMLRKSDPRDALLDAVEPWGGSR